MMVLDRVKNLASPGNAACIAALLIAIGFEVNEPLLKHVLDIIGGIIAFLGFFV